MKTTSQPAPALPTRGRPPTYASEAEREEATRRRNSAYQTSEEYKKRRKERYAKDRKYRNTCLERSRAFSESLTQPAHEAYARAVARMVDRRAVVGRVRVVSPATGKGRSVNMISYSIPEAALIVCRPASVLRAWIGAGRWPAPRYSGVEAGRGAVKVYTDKQVVALADAAVKHLRTASAHLLASKREAIVALHRAMAN